VAATAWNASQPYELKHSPGKPLMKGFTARMRLLMLVLGGTAVSLGWTQAAANHAQPATVSDQSTIAIGPGDLLDITVFDVPELVLKVRVDVSGCVSLALIGDVKLAGMTVGNAQRLIARELVARQLVKDPQVSIFIEEFATQGITVYGEVNTPGIYPLMGPHRLYDVISAAGGLTLKAGRTVTVLHAGETQHPEVIALANLNTSENPPERGTEHGREYGTEYGNDQSNVPVYPGDTVVVSKAGMVYVLGEVNKPGAFLMEDNTSISVLKATALAGGTTKLASLKGSMILRKSLSGTLQTRIPLDKIYRGKASDLQLHAEDIVFIPLSNIKNYGTLGLQGAIQAAVYSVYAAELH
jgi:polysaccharide biosynthesis/export protein